MAELSVVPVPGNMLQVTDRQAHAVMPQAGLSLQFVNRDCTRVASAQARVLASGSEECMAEELQAVSISSVSSTSSIPSSPM